MQILCTFILRERWSAGKFSIEKIDQYYQLGNFLHPVGDKDNLWNVSFLGIIRIGMNQLMRLTVGWADI